MTTRTDHSAISAVVTARDDELLERGIVEALLADVPIVAREFPALVVLLNHPSLPL